MTAPGIYPWFRASARRDPEAIALEVGGARLGYAELDDLAGRLATLVTEGGRPGAVGLCAARTVLAYAGYLAAQRAGVPVVPLNPAAPATRNETICRSAGVEVMITDDTGAAQAAALLNAGPWRVIHPTGERWWRDGPVADRTLPAHPIRPGDVSYVLFTSGSTGRPKGVPIRHRQLADYTPYCARRYDVGPGSRLSQTFDLTFDPSVFDMSVAWYAGATLVVPQQDEILTPARFVGEHRISHWYSVPSVISLAGRLRGLRPGSMPELRWSLFAGEQLTLDQARSWAAAAPGSTIENLFGPTELTITCVAYRLPADIARWPETSNGTVPIGRPNPYLEVMLLAEDGTRAAAEGELCVRGSQRFDGYLRPEDNRDRFVRERQAPSPAAAPSPGDWYRTGDLVGWQAGELVHLGRIDDQVKISGHRVELGEIESVLRRHPAVDEAVVVTTAGPGGPVLHGLYTGRPVAGRGLAEHCRERLPEYMVPADVQHLDAFPLNANGKIDRTALRTMLAAPDTERVA